MSFSQTADLVVTNLEKHENAEEQKQPENSPSTHLPSLEDFLSLALDESRETKHSFSGYSVYHKYNKTC